MKMLFSVLLLLMTGNLIAQKPVVSIIPEPASMMVGEGHYKFPAEILINTNDDAVKELSINLASKIKEVTGHNTRMLYKVSSAASIDLIISKDASIPAEGYKLTVNDKGIQIMAGSAAGMFYGIQTFDQ